MEHLLHRRLLGVVAREEVVVELRQRTLTSCHPSDLGLDGRAAGIGFGSRRAFGLRVIRRPENLRQLAIVFFEGEFPAGFIRELVPGVAPR